MIKIAICDDSLNDAAYIESAVKTILQDNRIVFELKVFQNSTMLWYEIEDGVFF